MSTLQTSPQAPPRRENSSDELEHFKQDISLVAYATQQHGYDVKDSSRRGDWHKLHKDGETLIVTRKPDGHEIYMNPGDDRDNGSIVDFVKARGAGHGQGMNLGQVRQTLRAYLNEDGPARDKVAFEAMPRPVQSVERRPLPEGLSEQESKNFLISEALGVQPKLTDRTYLHSRGLSDATIDAPAFENRVFTAQNGHHKNTAFPLYNEGGITTIEEKNTGFKSMLPGAKDGIWVSQPTQGRGTPVERVVVMESAVDAMSKYQLEQSGGRGPNTMYVATAGQVTESQTALIQRLVDRQQPKELTLANDNDAAGRRFNINYLNDLQPARKEGAVAGLPVYEQSAPPITWHATAAGRYNTGLTITVNHEKAHEGRTAVASMTERIAQLNGGEAHSEHPPLSLSVERTSSQQTVMRVGAANADMPALELLARELHQQREQRMPEAERQPAGFLKIEYAQSKDYTRDLEMVAAGMSPEERAAQAQLEQQQKQQQLQQKQLAEQQQQLAEQQRQEQLRMQQQQERERLEQQERERQQNSPEAQRQRQEDDRKLSEFMVGAAAADTGVPVQFAPPVRAAVPGVDQTLIPNMNQDTRHVELSIPGTEAEQEKRMQQLGQQLQQLGMTPGTVTSERGETSLILAYRMDQPELRQIHDRLATLEQEHPDLTLQQNRAVLTERTDRVEGERVGPATWETSQRAATELYIAQEPERQGIRADIRGEDAADPSAQLRGPGQPYWVGEGAKSATAQAWLYQREGEILPEAPAGPGQERYLLINTTGRDSLNQPLHESVAERLHQAGAGTIDANVQPATGTEPEKGQVRVAYQLNGSTLDAVHHELEQLRKQPGVEILGGETQRAERVDVLAGQYVRQQETTLPALREQWQLDQAPSAEKFAQESREGYQPGPAAATRQLEELKTSPYYQHPLDGALRTESRMLQLEVPGTGEQQRQQLAEAGERLRKEGVEVADVVAGKEKTYLAVRYQFDQSNLTDVSRALDKEAAGGITVNEPYAARFMRHDAVEAEDRARYRALNPNGPLNVPMTQDDGSTKMVPNPAPEFEEARRLRREQGLPTLEEDFAKRQQQWAQEAQEQAAKQSGPGLPTPPGTAQLTADAATAPAQAEREKQTAHAEQKANDLDKVAPPAEQPKETEQQQSLRDRARAAEANGEQLAIVKVAERIEPGQENQPGKAERIHGALESAGANASEVKSHVGDDGIKRSEMAVSYRTDQPTIKDISQQLDRAGRSDGVEVLELPEHKSARQEAAQKVEQARTQPEIGR
jgi:Toprim-like